MKGVSIDEALCAYLKKYHKGQENAASSKELEAAFHVGGTELRRWSTAGAVTATPFERRSGYFYAARAVRGQGNRRPAHRAASLKSPRQQRACCNLMRKRRDRAWRKTGLHCRACGAKDP